MSRSPFDEHANAYDAWFTANPNVLASEVRLVREALRSPGRTLSVGCGSGLFETILRREYGVEIREGVEPAAPMAETARQRGLDVAVAPSEGIPHADATFDTVLLNGVCAYVRDLDPTFLEAKRVLGPGGHVVVADVPASSGFGLLYRLAGIVGTWDDPRIAPAAPPRPYPAEFVGSARWRTTEEIVVALRDTGFADFEFLQTLTTHPKFADEAVEDPSAGFSRGSYVAVRARRPTTERSVS